MRALILVALLFVGCGEESGDSIYNTYCYESPGIQMDVAQSLVAEAQDNGIEVADYRSALETETVTIVTCGGQLVELRDNAIDAYIDIDPETNLGINEALI